MFRKNSILDCVMTSYSWTQILPHSIVCFFSRLRTSFPCSLALNPARFFLAAPLLPSEPSSRPLYRLRRPSLLGYPVPSVALPSAAHYTALPFWVIVPSVAFPSASLRCPLYRSSLLVIPAYGRPVGSGLSPTIRSLRRS